MLQWARCCHPDNGGSTAAAVSLTCLSLGWLHSAGGTVAEYRCGPCGASSWWWRLPSLRPIQFRFKVLQLQLGWFSSRLDDWWGRVIAISWSAHGISGSSTSFIACHSLEIHSSLTRGERRVWQLNAGDIERTQYDLSSLSYPMAEYGCKSYVSLKWRSNKVQYYLFAILLV